MTLEELWTRWRAGDEQAATDLFNQLRPHLIAVARSKGASLQDMEDVADVAIVKILEHAADYDPTRPLLPWVRNIASRKAIDHRRVAVNQRAIPFCTLDKLFGIDGRPKRFEPADTEVREAPEQAHANAEAAEIMAALNRLGPRERQALDLVHLQGLTNQEAADAIGIPLPTMKSRIRRGHEILKRIVCHTTFKVLAERARQAA